MNSFHKIVLLVAIVSLTLILFMLYYSITNENSKFPPVTGSCPDYWVHDKKKGCMNVNKIGSSDCEPVKDFDSEEWKGQNGMCLKQKWAKQCDLTWDGITTNSDLCNGNNGNNGNN